MQDIRLTPLSGTIGAEIHGIDLSQDLDEERVQIIRNTLLEYHVVFFPNNAPISIERQVAMGRCFGELQTSFPSFVRKLDGHPEVLRVDGSRVRATKWHTDVTVADMPPMGCIFNMVDPPQRGGDTMWSDMCAAFDALSETMQNFLEKLRAVHDMTTDEYRSRPGNFDIRHSSSIDFSHVPSAEHPVIRVHPESGRKGLFVNPLFTSHIVGLTPAESSHLLDYLFSHMERPEFIVRRRWSRNDVAFWDNRTTMHKAVNDYGTSPRLAYRICIKGDLPYGVPGV
jgi:taurine dioxygenase